MRRRWARRAAQTALTAALAATLWFCARQTLRPAGLGGAALAAGSFFASPAAAAEAALQGLAEAEPAAAQPSPAPDADEPAAPAVSGASADRDESGPQSGPNANSAPGPTAQPARPASDPSPLPGETPPPAATPAPVSDPPAGAGKIVSAHYQQSSGEGYIPCGTASIKNCTALPDAEVAQIITEGLPFAIDPASDAPQVLIMHTHATETYELADNGWYDPDFTCRSTDTAVNMAAVGARIAAQLNAAGIVTLQDTTLHDYPSYNGSYAKSNETVRRYLAEYPSIKVVLDVHRDAIEQPDGTRVKPLAEIDGKPCAQVMIICGADKGGNLPNFRENLRFAAAWQAVMERRSPGLTRPVLFDYRYYNQDLTTGSLLIEVGGHANTLEEALNAGDLVGAALAELFTAAP